MRFNYSSKRDLYYEKAMKLYFEEFRWAVVYNNCIAITAQASASASA